MDIRRKAIVARNMLLRLCGRYLNNTFQVNTNPILVLGNEKSGTTAIAALLGYSSGLSVSLDIPRLEDLALKNRLFTGKMSPLELVLNNRLDFSRDIVKEPILTFFLPELIHLFPRSKIIFVVRDPRENIRSILDRCGIPGDRDNLGEEEVRHVILGWRRVLEGEWIGEGECYIEILASRWNVATDQYFQNQERLILVKYEDFIKNKVGEIARLTKKLNLASKKDIVRRVDFQYQGRGQNRGISWYEFFGETNLAKIEGICGSRMKRFGYPCNTINR